MENKVINIEVLSKINELKELLNIKHNNNLDDILQVARDQRMSYWIKAIMINHKANTLNDLIEYLEKEGIR